MDYIFGTNGDFETLKTKGKYHTDLKGFQELIAEYPNETVTDHFRVVTKMDSKEDVEGNCYDWYQIDQHYRTIDKTGPISKNTEQLRADVDYLAIMGGIDL